MSTVTRTENSDSDIKRSAAEFQRLLTDAQAGDTQAIETLLKRYLPGVRSIMQERLDSDIRAQVSVSDLAQTTLLEIHHALQQFRGETPQQFAAWIETIAANNVLNEYRYWSRQKRAGARRTRALDSAVMREAADDTLTPYRRSSRNEQQQKLEDTMQKLPDEYQQVIQLRNREGLEFAEIGTVMGRSADAARMLWARALERLAAELKAEQE